MGESARYRLGGDRGKEKCSHSIGIVQEQQQEGETVFSFHRGKGKFIVSNKGVFIYMKGRKKCYYIYSIFVRYRARQDGIISRCS